MERLLLICLLLGRVNLQRIEQDEDGSLEKLLTNRDSKIMYHVPDQEYTQHLQEIESNINGGNIVQDEVPIKLPGSVDFARQELKSLSDESLEHLIDEKPHTSELTPDLNIDRLSSRESAKLLDGPAGPSAFNPATGEEVNAQKREEERYESKILGNPRPMPDKDVETFIVDNGMEMEEGDAAKNGFGVKSSDKTDIETENLKETLRNVQAENYERNNSNPIGSSNRGDLLDTKQENETSLKNENRAINEFSSNSDDSEMLSPHHRLESEMSNELALNEEESLTQRLNFLKMKLKHRQKINQLKEQDREKLENRKLFSEKNKQEKPKYKMYRIDNSNLNIDLNAETEKASKKPSLVLKNITDIAHVRGPVSGVNRALFAFSYDLESPFGPLQWQMLNPDWTCTARKQSPVNIEKIYVQTDTLVKNIMIQITPIHSPLTGLLRNNGHAPTLSISNDISVKLFGGTLNNDYYLKQLHFHFGCDSRTGSEHQIDGTTYPLELHLVFWDNSTFATFPEAAKADRGIAVVAVLFEAATIPYDGMKESPLSQAAQLVRHIEEEGENVTVSEEFNFRLEKLIPNVMNPERVDRFYIYEGSLTTPGCYESVTWIVLATHPPVSESQLRVFRTLQSTKVSLPDKMCNNYRPVQKKHGRRIYSNIV